MSIFDFLRGQKKTSASIAKNRLQLILINERSSDRSPDFMQQMQQELIAVISKYVQINPDDIKVNLDRQDSLDVLEVKIEMPQADARS
ncbi:MULTISPECIES: cell division topological specificity factor MinE [unclassified Castellaniella]|jgi:cell division topological specificity factor|uniref:cell division topological specificity factor MinE n=1 Tax=unclassified Castellaniella TaxID=2617606 RepID=UPI003315B783